VLVQKPHSVVITHHKSHMEYLEFNPGLLSE